MPPGAVSLDDVDLDQVSVDFVLNCARKGRESPAQSIASTHLLKMDCNHQVSVDFDFLFFLR